MPSIIPTQIFPGYELLAAGETATAESIAIPIAALTGLLSAEANAASGDGREVARILCQTIADNVAALGASAPSFMSVSQPNLSTLSATRVRKALNFTFDIDVPVTNLQMPNEV